jgi:hypothetical protein
MMLGGSTGAKLVLAAALLAATALGGLSVCARGTPAAATPFRIVFGAGCYGEAGPYSVLPDGSGLTRLLPRDRRLVPLALSGDGGTIAYRAGSRLPFTSRLDRFTGAIYVSRANGSRLHRVVASGSRPALSRDGRRLAFVRGGVIWIVGTNGRGLRRIGPGSNADWSRDGKAVVLSGGAAGGVFVQPLRGGRRELVPRGQYTGPAKWSPDGRWIAYDDIVGRLYLVRPSGAGRHRLGPLIGEQLWWAPDGRTLAVKGALTSGGDVRILGLDGRTLRRLRLGDIDDLSWSPDARQFALIDLLGQPPQLLVVGSDGRGLRHLTSACWNILVGWTRLAPNLPPASPTERVVGEKTVVTRDPVAALSADGARVAFVARSSPTDCAHVDIWTLGVASLQRLGTCGRGLSAERITEFGLAGSRAAWVSVVDNGQRYALMESGTLADPRAAGLAVRVGLDKNEVWHYHLHGNGDLLVFNDRNRLVRIGTGDEKCEESSMQTTSICTTLRRGADACCVESISAGLIATLKAGRMTVFDQRGAHVRVFPFMPADVKAARLDGDRLVVWRPGRLERYKTSTGTHELTRPLPSGYRLEDVDGGIAVLRQKNTILLLRLADGRSLTLTPGRGPVFADLAPPGLYYSYTASGGRIVFLPRSELVRQLDQGA